MQTTARKKTVKYMCPVLQLPEFFDSEQNIHYGEDKCKKTRILYQLA